jgi:hypothetical protein
VGIGQLGGLVHTAEAVVVTASACAAAASASVACSQAVFAEGAPHRTGDNGGYHGGVNKLEL